MTTKQPEFKFDERSLVVLPAAHTPAQHAALLLALEALAIAATGDIWKLSGVDKEKCREAGRVVRGMVDNKEIGQDDLHD